MNFQYGSEPVSMSFEETLLMYHSSIYVALIVPPKGVIFMIRKTENSFFGKN